MLKIIENLKKNNDVLKEINNNITNIKSECGSSFLDGVGNIIDIKDQIMYNEMMVDILEYWVSQVGPGALYLGKYIKICPRVLDTRMSLDLYLDSELSSKLYDAVFGSHSTIYQWVTEHFPTVFGMVIGRSIDSDISCFNHLGMRSDYNNEWKLSYDKKDFVKSISNGKRIIDDLVNLSKDSERMQDLDDVLKIYFDKIFKNYKDDYDDFWYGY